MKQVWQKENEIMLLQPHDLYDWYYEFKKGPGKKSPWSLWINGISYYWLLSNGWERV
jgi:hypothetical protein